MTPLWGTSEHHGPLGFLSYPLSLPTYKHTHVSMYLIRDVFQNMECRAAVKSMSVCNDTVSGESKSKLINIIQVIYVLHLHLARIRVLQAFLHELEILGK